ncbi:Na+-driven multidrug efflux pump [Orbus hercynius]|uniref:Na+-driven multidrug efflux pump n=1 Tax=Orbus hercynius TaxID=593135 RepID=A0A495RBA2_9GAMM|nr:hypothetical protein [Orbus hercynius]RKS84695.1 Na+-driven multidrug efflux pump [Orbus hercynius]
MSIDSSRIVNNTFILYGRMVCSVGIILYTTRIVLNALGATDYGIFELIAGLITMLSFLNTAMTVSTQRYLSYHLGKDNEKAQKQVFGNSLILHLLIAVFFIIGLNIVGLFLFDEVLNIPTSRINAAKYIYLFMSVSVFFSVLSVPFIAVLNARENMLSISIIYLLEVLLKLIIAILLLFISSDRLILYGLAMASISFASLLLYVAYCLEKYSECNLLVLKYFDKKMFHNLASFAGWNLVGALCGVAKVQGIAVILNIFYGTVINAAYGIANQISSQMTFLSLSMLRAINPQIMKHEGAGNREQMLKLSLSACKFGFLLFSSLSIPCLFEMKALLLFWLGSIPKNTVMFSSLLVITIMISQVSIGLQSAIQAIGKIKLYQSIVGGILLLNIPISVCILYFDLPIYYIFASMIIMEIIALIFRLTFLKNIAKLSMLRYLNDVLFRCTMPILFSIIVCYISVSFLDFSYRFIFTILISMSFFALTSYLYGLDQNEQLFIKRKFKRVMNK